jgi:hypothetical protein
VSGASEASRKRCGWASPQSNSLAVMYPDEKNKKTPSKAVAHIVELHKGLSQLAQEFPWIVGFLEEILKGGLSRNKSVSTKLNCLSEKEARRIGKNLPQALRARKTAGAGVLQWEKQNPSMVELFKKYPWVEEMVLTMGEEVRARASGERSERRAKRAHGGGFGSIWRDDSRLEDSALARRRPQANLRLWRSLRSRTRSCSRTRPGGCGSG